jgi:hypothetical protein
MWHARGRSDGDRVLVGKPNKGYHLEDLGIDAKITLKFILKERTGRTWNGLVCLGTGTRGRPLGCCGHSDVPLGSVKLGKFLDCPRN